MRKWSKALPNFLSLIGRKVFFQMLMNLVRRHPFNMLLCHLERVQILAPTLGICDPEPVTIFFPDSQFPHFLNADNMPSHKVMRININS